MNNILHMMVGLPRSGKSTLAKQLGFPIVEGDAIRKTFNCYPFNPKLEPIVWATADLMVKSLFNAGHTNVILDATNHTKARRSLWESPLWSIKYHIVDTPLDICLQRAVDTNKEYLVPHIKRMAMNWEHLDHQDC